MWLLLKSISFFLFDFVMYLLENVKLLMWLTLQLYWTVLPKNIVKNLLSTGDWYMWVGWTDEWMTEGKMKINEWAYKQINS